MLLKMTGSRIICLIIVFMVFSGCESARKNVPATNSEVKRAKSKQGVASNSKNVVAAGLDSNPEGPTFKEVLDSLKVSYNRVKIYDKRIVDGKDNFQVFLSYYCLHDSSLIAPKHYLWGGDSTKDFVANTFASKIILIKNADTIFTRVFKKSDFDSVMWDPLRRYACIFDTDYTGYDKNTGEFAFGFTLDIPLTDVGLPATVTIDKKGNYKVRDEYFKVDGFKK